jgi:transcriptional regulator with XRE-family HTH domain
MPKKALCEAAGVSRSSLDAYLTGERQPSVAQIERLARAAGLRIDISFRPLDIKPLPAWVKPDNPEMRPIPTTVAERAQILERVVPVAMAQRRRARGELEFPPFKTLLRHG